MKFILVENSEITRALWNLEWNSGQLICFKRPEDFFCALTQEPELIKSISGIVSGFYFEIGSEFTGKTFACELRRRGVDIPFIIASDGKFSLNDFDGFVDDVIPKEIPSSETLKYILAKKQSAKT